MNVVRSKNIVTTKFHAGKELVLQDANQELQQKLHQKLPNLKGNKIMSKYKFLNKYKFSKQTGKPSIQKFPDKLHKLSSESSHLKKRKHFNHRKHSPKIVKQSHFQECIGEEGNVQDQDINKSESQEKRQYLIPENPIDVQETVTASQNATLEQQTILSNHDLTESHQSNYFSAEKCNGKEHHARDHSNKVKQMIAPHEEIKQMSKTPSFTNLLEENDSSIVNRMQHQKHMPVAQRNESYTFTQDFRTQRVVDISQSLMRRGEIEEIHLPENLMEKQKLKLSQKFIAPYKRTHETASQPIFQSVNKRQSNKFLQDEILRTHQTCSHKSTMLASESICTDDITNDLNKVTLERKSFSAPIKQSHNFKENISKEKYGLSGQEIHDTNFYENSSQIKKSQSNIRFSASKESSNKNLVQVQQQHNEDCIIRESNRKTGANIEESASKKEHHKITSKKFSSFSSEISLKKQTNQFQFAQNVLSSLTDSIACSNSRSNNEAVEFSEDNAQESCEASSSKFSNTINTLQHNANHKEMKRIEGDKNIEVLQETEPSITETELIDTSVDLHNREKQKLNPHELNTGALSKDNHHALGQRYSSTSLNFNTSSSPDRHNKIYTSTMPRSSSSCRSKSDSGSVRSGRQLRNHQIRTTPVSSTNSAVRYTTSSDERTLSSKDNSSHCVVALCEGRGHARGEVGIAALDTDHPHLILCQISDYNNYANTLSKLNVFNPIEILIPDTLKERHQNKLYQLLTDTYSHINIATVQRRHYNDKSGLQQIQNVCLNEYSSVVYLIREKFYALSASAALLRYIEFIQNVTFAPNTLKVEYQGSHNTTVIDVNTANRLELVGCGQGMSYKNSLLGNLNHCFTRGGSRLLRANILQPPRLLKIIEERLDAVEELVNKSDMLHNLQMILPKLSDAEHLLTLCMYPLQQDGIKAAEQQFRYVTQLKSVLELLPSLICALEEAQSTLLNSVRQALLDPQFQIILDRICEIIHPDVQYSKGHPTHMQQNFAIKPNVNTLLDLARRTYCETIDAMDKHVKDLSSKYNLPLSVTMSSSQVFKIQLTLSSKQATQRIQLPSVFKQVQKYRNSFLCMTEEMFSLNLRCKEAMREIQLMSNAIIYKILTEVKTNFGCLYQMCESIMQLDMLMSFAYVSSVTDYVRPKFGNVLDLQNARHPMLDFISNMEVVPNHVVATNENNFHIITGPNMSGKSIYIKQVAVLQIMAQLGCYVPASSAMFRISDHILSRIGFGDSIECNASSFVIEIMEMLYISQTVTSSSLVIIDELCRATSVEEGTALTWGFCEDLVQTKAFIFLATHYKSITRFPELYFTTTNFQLEVIEEGSKIIHTHNLLPGANRERNYGIRLAKHMNFPSSIAIRAEEISKEIDEQRKELESKEDNEERELYNIVAGILASSTPSQPIAKQEFINIKKSCLVNDSDVLEPVVLINEPDDSVCVDIQGEPGPRSPDIPALDVTTEDRHDEIL